MFQFKSCPLFTIVFALDKGEFKMDRLSFDGSLNKYSFLKILKYGVNLFELFEKY